MRGLVILCAGLVLACSVPAPGEAAEPTPRFGLDVGAQGIGSDGVGGGARGTIRLTSPRGFHVGFGAGGAALGTWYVGAAAALDWRVAVGGTIDPSTTQRVYVEAVFSSILTTPGPTGSVGGNAGGHRFYWTGRVTILELLSTTPDRHGIGGYIDVGFGTGVTYDFLGLWPYLEIGFTVDVGPYRRSKPGTLVLEVEADAD